MTFIPVDEFTLVNTKFIAGVIAKKHEVVDDQYVPVTWEIYLSGVVAPVVTNKAYRQQVLQLIEVAGLYMD